MADLSENRPDPELLLKKAAQEQSEPGKGKLKIFFGAAPGVGKTYAMLEAAHALKQAGVDVVAGLIETHSRSETAAKLAGLEVLPRGKEFDLDAALKRKPELILVDELAHSNLAGSRHLKRWQDVVELLNAGIDVYSTLNVQHLESLNDVVAQITGVIVRETIPDQVLEHASEMELVDLPVDELLGRMRGGKIYSQEQAERALVHFFKSTNLNALRELALRRTAEHVDTNLVAMRTEAVTEETWPVTERLLLAIGPSPYSKNLIRATRRLATQWNAEWYVIHVDSGGTEQQKHVQDALNFAATLGAKTAAIRGQSVAGTILEFARSRNVTRILVGKSPGSKLVGALIDISAEISVIALDGGAKMPHGSWPRLSPPQSREIRTALVYIAVATVVSLLLRDHMAAANLVMIYLISVVAIAMRSSRETAILSSIVAVASFDFFCVPPYLTFAVSDVEYLITFAVMLAVSLIISTLTVRLRSDAKAAVERENRTAILLQFSRQLADVQRIFEAAELLASATQSALGTGTNVFLADTGNQISFRRRVSNSFVPPAQEEGIAQWCFDHGLLAGKGAATLPGATAQYRPISAAGRTLAVIAIEEPPRDVGQSGMLEALLNQAAQAIERLTAREQARQSALEAEGERLRNSLLSSVSHDLRTPLTAIAGSAAILSDQQAALDEGQKRNLVESIREQSHRMNRLVSNLLEMSRLKGGEIHLRLEACSIEEIAASVADAMEPSFGARQLHLDMAPDLPLVDAEPQLLSQALQNLVENAIKYSPEASTITIEGSRDGDRVKLAVLDEGPGLPPEEIDRIFDRFYRGPGTGRVSGAGLGLAIVKAVAEAHGGHARVLNRPRIGARFEIAIPARRR